MVPSAASLIIKALKEPPRDRKKQKNSKYIFPLLAVYKNKFVKRETVTNIQNEIEPTVYKYLIDENHVININQTT